MLERADRINAPPKATPVWSRPSSVNGDPQVAAVVGSPIQLVHCVLTSTAQPSLLNKAQGLQLTAILGLESLHQLKAIGPLAFKGYPTLVFFQLELAKMAASRPHHSEPSLGLMIHWVQMKSLQTPPLRLNEKKDLKTIRYISDHLGITTE